MPQQNSQTARNSAALGNEARPQSGRPGLDFTARMRLLCEHVVETLEEFRHIDLGKVVISFAQTRKAVMHGLQASLTPLRFEGGATIGTVRGKRYTVQPVHDQDGNEMLYVLNFYLPRFMHLAYREKLVTVFHELWHISPQFNGDLRRHPGRCFAHSHSQADYDQRMGIFVDAWLETEPPDELLEFMRLDFSQVQSQYGRVYGLKVRRPKLLPLK